MSVFAEKRIPEKETEKTTPSNYFQVSKMEVLNLLSLFWVWGFLYISLTYVAYN